MLINTVSFLYIFILGAVFGSFLNVVVDRLPKGQSIIVGRSYCDTCKKTILWRDLMPIVSYILLMGRCRFCHAHVSFYYPIVEVTAGFLFLFCAFTAGNMVQLVYSLLIMAILLIIFFADLKYGIIPFAAVIPGIIITLSFLLFFNPQMLSSSFFSAIGAFSFFLLIFLLTRGRGMGFGDVVYAFYMGLLLSYPAIIFGLYLSFLTGAVVSLILILVGKKRLSGDTIPFGPFLVFGTVVLFFYSNEVLQLVKHFIPLF